MSISQKDIKFLWGKSASRCAICKKILSHKATTDGTDFLIGEQAHIVARNNDGPRGISELSIGERDTYSNLILLCPNHNTSIDKNPIDYSIEKLHKIKSDHELWVQESLSGMSPRDKANEIIYADIIDSVVDSLKLYDFELWSSYALSNSNIMLPKNIIDNSFELSIKIKGSLFPGIYPELENSIINLVRTFLSTMNIFQLHANIKDNYYTEIRFYRLDRWDPELNKFMLDKYNLWIKTYKNLFYEFIKSLNFFADNVRESINPMFFATYGKFIVVEGDIMGFYPNLYEYTDEEKKDIPTRIDKLLEEIDFSKIN